MAMRHWMPVSIALNFCIAAYLVLSIVTSDRIPLLSSQGPSDTRSHAPGPNIWADLSQREADQLLTFLYEGSNDLNLTRWPTGDAGDKVLRSFQALRPNKTDAVSYVDDQAEIPPRWASLFVVEKEKQRSRLVQYMVGPLPPSNLTQILPLTYPYNSGRNDVTSPLRDELDFGFFIISVLQSIPDILQELTGGTLNIHDPWDPNGIRAGPRIVESNESTFVSWVSLFGTGSRSGEWSLQPHGIFIKIRGDAYGAGNWHVTEWLYNGLSYDSVDRFRDAMNSADFVKLPLAISGPWTDTEDFESDPPGRSLPPPVMVQPHGPRYNLDKAQKYVSWMGWTFYLSTANANGVSLFDVSFKGSRIMYSLELQEALSHYAGSDPAHGALYFFDAFFGMGLSQVELVPGYDCPVYADYLDTSYHLGNGTVVNKNSICIFEYTADHPISRHTSLFTSSVSRNTYLVIRSVSTVGNYDYQIDYTFYLDGTIEIKYRASGYIISAFYPPVNTTGNNEYGFRIHDAISSSLHTHVLNFRADLDIAGTTNTLRRIDIKPQTAAYPWDQPEVSSRNTMHMTTDTIEEETPLNWPSNSQSLYVIQNTDTTNAWSQPRGYRIMPGTMPGNPAHMPIENSTALNRSAYWSTADLFLTVHHDTEPYSSSPFSWLQGRDPLIDFKSFFADPENTTQADLVLYFNLGNHHVPTTSDVPNTLEHVSGSSVMFLPFNYFDRDASRTAVSGVRIDAASRSRRDDDGQAVLLEEDERNKIRYFGGHYAEHDTVGEQRLEADLSGFRGGKAGPWSAFGSAERRGSEDEKGDGLVRDGTGAWRGWGMVDMLGFAGMVGL